MKPALPHLLPLAWVSMAWLTSTACIGNSPQSYFFPPPNNGVGQTVSKALDSNGGTLQAASGAASVSIPAGALTTPTAVTVTVKDKALSPNATQLMSQVFDFGPDGTQFAQPVNIALKASDPPPTGKRATLAFLNLQGAWQVVPNSSYNEVSQTVTGAVNHFTNYAVYLVDNQGADCAASPDPNALCSPQICDMVHSLCAAAGGPPADTHAFSVGGTLVGLSGGTLVLTDNGNDSLSLATNGNFSFDGALASNAAYAVGIAQQPNNQFCLVGNASGRIANANITGVSVQCAPTYAIGGSVSGLLAGHTVTLGNGNDQVTVSASAPNFVVGRAVGGAAYAVGVVTPPVGQQCELTGSTGTVGMADVTSVQVACHTLSYPVGGQVQGLVGQSQVTLSNGNDSLVTGNGNFTFPTAVLYGGNFAATLVSPTGETCAFVGASSGTVAGAAVTSVSVLCTPATFTLGGQVTGLVAQTQVTIAQGNDSLATGNGTYTLPTQVAYGATYRITTTTTAGQACHFADGNTFLAATMPAGNVTNANLTCTPAAYSVGGTVTGLVGQGNVLLQNGSDSLSAYNGAYMFASSVAYGSSYAATLTSPAGEICTFTNSPNGTVGSANVTTLSVSCMPRTYTVGGTVSGLLSNNTVVLQNGADSLSVGNGSYTFATSVAYASHYNVTLTSPAGQTCTFSPGGSNTGTMGTGAVTGVNVVCGSKVYNLGGSVSGLLSNTTVTLSDGTDTINAANGPFTFPTGLAYASAYTATLMSPTGQSCAFSGASSGTMGAADVTSLSVACQTQTFALGGTVSGLVNNTQLTLHNGGDTTQVGNGVYTFATQVGYGATYSASLSAPVGQNCAFSPANSNVGTMPAANMNQLNIACTPQAFTLGGTVSGLVAGAMVSLQDGTDTLQVGLGAFTFPTPVVYNASFSVSVNAPPGQQCTLGGTQAGPMPAANVSDITVSCSPLSYTLGGTVTGLMYNESLTLQNGVDMLTVSGGAYTFATHVAFNSGYNVTFRAPGGQACSFSGPTSNAGTMPASNITDIGIACVLLPYSISIGAPGSVVTAAPFSVTVSILDVSGNVLTGYTGTVQLTSSDPSGSPNTTGQNVVFGSGDQGVVTVSSLQLTTLGQQMLVANDAVDQVQGEATVTVTAMFQADAHRPACGHFFSGVERADAALVPPAEADAKTHRVALWPPLRAPGLRAVRGRGVAGSDMFIAMQGVALGGAPSAASVDAFDIMPWDVTLGAASYLSYWVMPVAAKQDATHAQDAAYADDVADAALEVAFEDGTETTTLAGQGAHWVPDVWNHVQVPLGAYAGKRVRRLRVTWAQDRAEGPFEIRYDAIHLAGIAYGSP